MTGKVDWVGDEEFHLSSGFFAGGGKGEDHWVVLYTGTEVTLGPFQTLQVRPYFQSAKGGAERVQEAGLEGRYRFDLGGLAQAQIGGGLLHSTPTGVPGGQEGTRGRLEAGIQGDVLGMAMGDLALRFDRDGPYDAFGFLVGLQVVEEDLTWRGDLAKGGMPQGGGEVLEGGVGVRFQPDEHLDLTAKLFHENAFGKGMEGLRCGLQWRAERPFIGFPTRFELRVLEKVSRDGGGGLHWDTAAHLGFGILGPERFWVQGRSLSNGPLLLEAGSELKVHEGTRLFLVLSNLGNFPIPWPDGDSPIGTHLTGGFELDL
jgi:hypothetical protein